jgi:hypothetical protein
MIRQIGRDAVRASLSGSSLTAAALLIDDTGAQSGKTASY